MSESTVKSEYTNLPPLILRYQRVIDPARCTYGVQRQAHTTPENFEWQMRYLKDNYYVMDLETALTAYIKGQRLPNKSVVLTFDGGWIDTFVYAFPVLHRLGLATSVFLLTDFIGTSRFIWPDMVHFALQILQAKEKKFIPFSFFNEEICALLREASPDGEINYQLINLVILALAAAPGEDRFIGAQALCNYAAELGGQLPLEQAFMDWEEISIMEGQGVKFGSLGHQYVFFNDLNEKQSITEIEGSYAVLKRYIANPSNVFCFPEGVPGQFGLKAAKLKGAFAALGERSLVEEEEFSESIPIFSRIPISEATVQNEKGFKDLLERKFKKPVEVSGNS